MTAEDYVEVRLSEEGIAAAGKGAEACVRVIGYNYHHELKPGQTLRLPRAEFAGRLQSQQLNGKPLFEIAPARQGAAPSGALKEKN